MRGARDRRSDNRVLVPLSFAARHGSRLAALLVTIGVCLCAAQEKALEMRIRLKSMEFDPLTTPQPEAPAGGDRWIVQFTRSLTRAEMEQVQREYGLRLDRYIPEGAYLERADTGRIADLRRDPLVRWVGPYLPEYKLDPAVLQRGRADPSREIALLVEGYADVSSEALLGAIRRAGYTRAEGVGSPAQGTPRVHVVVAGPADVTAVTRLPEVLHIEPPPRIVIDRNE